MFHVTVGPNGPRVSTRVGGVRISSTGRVSTRVGGVTVSGNINQGQQAAEPVSEPTEQSATVMRRAPFPAQDMIKALVSLAVFLFIIVFFVAWIVNVVKAH